ncbi:hypothetical protein ACJMK2_033087 [Sinanodonta woodiana]|uniref:Uncharacterized protein n=1 Tax=Sinanodonta woodiana TaxID=1069815 RepID=A0ABD3X3S2_SINWO
MMKISAFKAFAILWVLGLAYAAGYSMGGGGYSGDIGGGYVGGINGGYGGGFGGLNGLYGGGYGGNSLGKKGYGSGSSSVLLLPVASGKGIGGIGGGFGGAGFGTGGEFGGILSFIFPLIILIIILPLITNIIPGTG